MDTKIEVRRMDDVALKLHKEPVFEHFRFKHDWVSLIVHQSLSNNLYAFGDWVRWLLVLIMSCCIVFTCNVIV